MPHHHGSPRPHHHNGPNHPPHLRWDFPAPGQHLPARGRRARQHAAGVDRDELAVIAGVDQLGAAGGNDGSVRSTV